MSFADIQYYFRDAFSVYSYGALVYFIIYALCVQLPPEEPQDEIRRVVRGIRLALFWPATIPYGIFLYVKGRL